MGKKKMAKRQALAFTTKRATLKEDLLAEYAAKKPKPFLQIAGLADQDDGDEYIPVGRYDIVGGLEWCDVLVMVRPDVPADKAARLLTTIAGYVANDFLATAKADLAREDARLDDLLCPTCGRGVGKCSVDANEIPF